MAITTEALWNWNTTTNPGQPTVVSYPNGAVTKTGLMPADLINHAGVPLEIGSPAVPVSDADLLRFIRWAEDYVETKTGILLCPSWVASPPETSVAMAGAAGLLNQGQQLGVDFDIRDAGYDFKFANFIEEGWGNLLLRYKPIRNLNLVDDTAVKNYAFIYPLLSSFFRLPLSWMVEDDDYGLLRVVPAQNVQMLPLFAIQLAVMGFAQTLPQAIHIQYTAGLTPADYTGKYSFMTQLVLAQAVIIAMSVCQTTINKGAIALMSMQDGVREETRFSPQGAYAGSIDRFQKIRNDLMSLAQDNVAGPSVIAL